MFQTKHRQNGKLFKQNISNLLQHTFKIRVVTSPGSPQSRSMWSPAELTVSGHLSPRESHPARHLGWPVCLLWATLLPVCCSSSRVPTAHDSPSYLRSAEWCLSARCRPHRINPEGTSSQTCICPEIPQNSQKLVWCLFHLMTLQTDQVLNALKLEILSISLISFCAKLTLCSSLDTLTARRNQE